MIQKKDTLEETRRLYLDLMKRCLTNWVYSDAQMKYYKARSPLKRALMNLFLGKSTRLVTETTFDPGLREEGKDWPGVAHTMIGMKRLNNIQFCAEEVIRNDVPGDFIETGSWRGGATIFMRAVLKAYGITDRRVWVADSFEGLPRPDPERYPEDLGDRHFEKDELRVSVEQVKSNFERYQLLDQQVQFLKGWFKDTLPTAPLDALAVIRLDGDMYESTMDGLTNLYDKLSPGGFLIVDDYGCIKACQKAVDDFRTERGITDPIQKVDWTGVFWQKS